MRDQAVRVELGIPRRVAARLAGVSLPTLDKYELDPLAVTPPKRAALGLVYVDFRALLAKDFVAASEAA